MTASKIVAAAASSQGSSTTIVDDVFQINTYEGYGGANKGQRVRNGVKLGSHDAGSFVYFGTPGNGVGTTGQANSGLYRTSDLTGNADGKVFTMSSWFQSDLPTNFTSYRISSSEGGGTTQFYMMTSGPLFKVAATNTSGTLVLDTGWQTIEVSGRWNHAVISVDLSNTSYRYLYINDILTLGPSSSWSTYTNQNIDFTGGYHYINAYRALTGADGATGGFTKVFLDYNYLDLSQSSNRQKFIVSNGAGGFQPSTTDLTTLSPIVYLPLDNQNAVTKNLGSGGDFTTLFPETIEQRSQGGPYYDSSVGDGGLVMVKNREAVSGTGSYWFLYDSEQSKSNDYMANLTTVADSYANEYAASSNGGIKDFTSDGFVFSPNGSNAIGFANGIKYGSWTWKKHEKFFDVVTYTGNGSNRQIAHNLNGTVGMLWVKKTSGSADWMCYHRGLDNGSSPETYYLKVNGTDAQNASATGIWNNTAPTSTHFTVGTDSKVNENGQTYVAYLWAHNNGDGEFGPDEDEDIIKCGVVTGTGSSIVDINLGFVPQWIMVKRISADTEGFQSYHSWMVQDTKRGLSPEPLGQAQGSEFGLMFNRVNEEGYRGNGSAAGSDNQFLLTDNGFALPSSGTVEHNRNNHKYIYVAVRKTQFDLSNITSSNEVFNIDEAGTRNTSNDPAFEARFDVATAIWRNAIDGTADFRIGTHANPRRYLRTNTNADGANDSNFRFDYDKGFNLQNSPDQNRVAWMFRQGRGFHDVTFYKGAGSTQNVIHNLGVVPEMMWIKLESSTNNWVVYHKDMHPIYPQNYGMYLDDYTARVDSANFFNDTAPTASQFTVGSASKTNGSGNMYAAYLWASIPGFVKIDKYTGTGSDQTIDCGFSTGTRFLMIKRATGVGNWNMVNTDMNFDSGTDEWLEFNADSPWSGSDFADPTTSGFTVKGSNGGVNGSGETYIYWAIAAP